MNKTARRRALGRGLSALIPADHEDAGSQGGTEMVDAHALTPNPFQPRTDFDQEEIDGLAKSIEAQGLLQPVIVRKKVNGYEIVSGERRVRAMKQLGWDQIPCIVKGKVSDREMLELALVENIQRENLNDIEQAAAYQRLLLECSLSHEELSERVGKSRSTITNTLRLLKLPQHIQQLIRDGAITSGHARALLAVDDTTTLRRLADRIAKEGLSVREIEEAVRESKGAAQPRPRKPRKDGGAGHNRHLDPDTTRCLEQLQYRYGTAVRINGGTDKGRVEIHYSTGDDLNRVLNLLLGEQ
ncbi:MAG: ParB/RepB/Spo0J family partition protein [Chitinivibrionales bacterium]|nr:ParB/RepB/Spo0J family partition protein [Chitinivibrionales bacterium]